MRVILKYFVYITQYFQNVLTDDEIFKCYTQYYNISRGSLGTQK